MAFPWAKSKLPQAVDAMPAAGALPRPGMLQEQDLGVWFRLHEVCEVPTYSGVMQQRAWDMVFIYVTTGKVFI